MLRLVGLLLVVSLLTVGCLGNGGSDEKKSGPGTSAAARVDAPWWEIGASWTIEFEQAGKPRRTTTLVNFANNTFGDPEHFWLGVKDRNEAMEHVFHETNPFLGRIHWEILAPHEKGMHSAMYKWPMEDGSSWSSPILFGKKDIQVQAAKRPDGTFLVTGASQADGTQFTYDYDPATEWFRKFTITEDSGAKLLDAVVRDHKQEGAKGTYHFLRGRDYLDAKGGSTGSEEKFTVKDEGATSIAFLLDVQAGPASYLDFIGPDGASFHQYPLATGGKITKIDEIQKIPPPGEWKLRYVGSVTGTIKVRGVIEYKATL